jgi:endonuclease YncB( thermonuclease family)
VEAEVGVTRLLAFALTATLLPTAVLADITGKPRVIDGDTIEVASQRIRLHGIDAPELDQTCKVDDRIIQCGEIAKAALMDLVFLSAVTCKADAENGRTYNRSWQMHVHV